MLDLNTVREQDLIVEPTHFTERLKPYAKTNDWFNWKGYMACNTFECEGKEYAAIRSGTGVFDICPMSKYDITGPDAMEYLNRIMTRDIAKLNVDRVTYVIWCDDNGYIQDDGTLFRLSENHYRLCSYEHAMDWLMNCAEGFDVEIKDTTRDIAALAVQGPTSFGVLEAMGLEGLENLKPFGIMRVPFKSGEIMISRTGFTGDLGYELWTTPDLAGDMFDELFEAGRLRALKPMGAIALDLARIEAGFVQAGVDFLTSEHVIRTGRQRTPLELDMEWLVDFNKPLFNGRKALLKQKEEGPRYRFVKLDVEGNKPAHNSFIFNKGKQVGTVTSAAWCPTAKTNVAFAMLEWPYGRDTDNLEAEIYFQRELGWTKVMAKCKPMKGPAFDPARKRATPPSRI